MSRVPSPRSAFVYVFLITLGAAAALAESGIATPKVTPKVSGPSSLNTRGEIVDCSEYLLMGKKGNDRIEVQAKNIDSGMPACFIADSGEIYLLVEYGEQARSKFQPSQTFIDADVIVEGVVYERGSLKALSISDIKRTGGYTDRESRRPSNPEPTRRLTTDPKQNHYVPTPAAQPAEPEPANPQPK